MPLFSRRQRSQFRNYDHVARIPTSAPVTALSLSDDGNLIAVGSANGLAIHREDVTLTVPVFEAMYGAVQSIAWDHTRSPGDLVAFVTRSSWVYIWSNAEGPDVFLSKCEYRASDTESPSCLSILKVTPSNLRVAVGTTRGSLIIHDYNIKGTYKHVASIDLEFLPQALKFEASASSLLVVGKENGKMTRVNVDETKFTWEAHVSPIAASATFTTGNLVVDNAINGFSTFRIDTGEHQHTYRPPRLFGGAIAQASHTPNGRWLICGSDHGKGYVYDTQQVRTHDVITHASEGTLKYISVAACEDGHIIACALDTEILPRKHLVGVGLGQLTPSFITLWKTSKVVPRKTPMEARSAFHRNSGPLVWLLLVLNMGCVCFTVACFAYGSAIADGARGLIRDNTPVSGAREPVTVTKSMPIVDKSAAGFNRIQSSYKSWFRGIR